MQQTAKRESIGFECDDEITQLLAQIDTAILRIKTDYSTIRENVSDAYNTLKSVQQREQRKKIYIIISIIAILLLLVAVFAR